MYGYPCCGGYGYGGASWVWLIVIIIFFVLFWGNGLGNNWNNGSYQHNNSGCCH